MSTDIPHLLGSLVPALRAVLLDILLDAHATAVQVTIQCALTSVKPSIIASPPPHDIRHGRHVHRLGEYLLLPDLATPDLPPHPEVLPRWILSRSMGLCGASRGAEYLPVYGAHERRFAMESRRQAPVVACYAWRRCLVVRACAGGYGGCV